MVKKFYRDGRINSRPDQSWAEINSALGSPFKTHVSQMSDV